MSLVLHFDQQAASTEAGPEASVGKGANLFRLHTVWSGSLNKLSRKHPLFLSFAVTDTSLPHPVTSAFIPDSASTDQLVFHSIPSP